MAKMPGATQRPITVNYTKGGQDDVRGVVVHIMAGTLAGTDSWFRNPKAQASSHFGTGKGGALYQWVDTADRAWAQASGNRTWLSVENEGKGGDTLTEEQLDRNAEVLAWAHEKYGVPLQVAAGPNGYGLGYHAMGGDAWGGHTSCPGPKIVAQLPLIVERAKRLVNAATEDEVTEEQMDKIADRVVARLLSADKFDAPEDAKDYDPDPKKAGHYWSGRTVFRDLVTRVRRIDNTLTALSAALTKGK